jgi:amicoumacin kinase
MEQHIIQRYSDSIKSQIWQRFDIDEATVTDLGGFESFIYEYQYENEPRILRVSHSDRYSSLQIHGEIDFLRYLAAHGANVAAAYLSPRGNLVEGFEDTQGGQYLVSSFRKAKGGRYGQWSEEFIQHYGETIGQLHRLSTEYTPTKEEWTRLAWDDPEMLNYLDWLQAHDAEIYASQEKLVAYLHKLARDNKNYGLIHQDAHGGNFFVHEGQITLFDFADACYAWYALDIALILFYALSVPRDDPSVFTDNFMKNFLVGYRREFDIDSKWMAEIPYFMRQREIDIWAFIERDIPNWCEMDDVWLKRMMTGRREAILEERPFVDYDFSRLV